jgi:cob(I)alamin adenosyltransferase
MLYTRRGDDGTTKILNAKMRIRKGSLIVDALGALDEVNTFLGLCKVHSGSEDLRLKEDAVQDFVQFIQEQLFIIQAEVAGADKSVAPSSVKELERITDWIEGELLPIKTFRIAGGSELSALFDIARTMARRAERTVIRVYESALEVRDMDKEENMSGLICEPSTQFLNRLSSALYALARYANKKSGIEEVGPSY